MEIIRGDQWFYDTILATKSKDIQSEVTLSAFPENGLAVNLDSASLSFGDEIVAQRVADHFRHAADLCREIGSSTIPTPTTSGQTTSGQKPLKRFVPPKPQDFHYPDCSKKHFVATDLEVQGDVVLGKERMVVALISKASTWMEVNPNNPEALEVFRDLRQFMSAYLDESEKLSYMLDHSAYWDESEKLFYGLDQTDQAKGIPTKDLAEKLDQGWNNGIRIDSAMRQLEAMGFDRHGDGWGPKWEITRTLDPNKGCYVVITSMK